MGVRREGILFVDDVGGGSGAPVSINDPIGQKTMAASVSVTVASDQSPIPVTAALPVTISGTLTNNGDVLDLNVSGMGSLSADITAVAGGWDGHLDFYGSANGVDFESITTTSYKDNGTVGALAPRSFMVENDGIVRFNVAALKTFRLKVSFRTTGTVTAVLFAAAYSYNGLVTAVQANNLGRLRVVDGFGASPITVQDQSGNALAKDPGTNAARALAIQGVSGGIPVATSDVAFSTVTGTFGLPVGTSGLIVGGLTGIGNFEPIPISTDTFHVRVDGSDTVQPVSGTVSISGSTVSVPGVATEVTLAKMLASQVSLMQDALDSIVMELKVITHFLKEGLNVKDAPENIRNDINSQNSQYPFN